LNDKIQDLITAKGTFIDNHHTSIDAWNKWKGKDAERKRELWIVQKEQNDFEWALRQKEREERKERQKEADAAAASDDDDEDGASPGSEKRNPHQKEITLCNSLLAFLESTRSSQPRRPTTTTTIHTATKDQTAAFEQQLKSGGDRAPKLKAGMVLKKKDGDDEEDWLYGNKGKKKQAKKQQQSESLEGFSGGRNTQKPVSRPVSIPAPHLHAFGQLGVKPPYTTGDVGRAVKELREKKQKFQKEPEDDGTKVTDVEETA